MTRRDIAALRLAYECVRQRGDEPHPGCDAATDALDALDLGDAAARHIRWCAAPGAARRCPEWRVFRARLALLLRAMLREAPTQAVRVCNNCGTRDQIKITFNGSRCLACNSRSSVYSTACIYARRTVPLRYRALWELAPEHRT